MAAVAVALGVAATSGDPLTGFAGQQPAGNPELSLRVSQARPAPPIGYDDTPVLPGSKWRVHDIKRPHPRAITPGPAPQPAPIPSDAIILFDGKDLSKWQVAPDKPAAWKVENGYMEVVRRSGSITTKEKFGDCQLHIEWAAPAEVVGSSQGRGNSGVLFMGRYEIQVLDSYQNITYADGQAAAIYGQYPPLVNASRKPGEWQSYDIVFETPRFEGEKLVKPGFVTVIHNGVLVHHRQEILGAVRHKILPVWEPHPPEGPLQLQDHGNPLRFRNIWVRRLGRYDEP